MGAPPQAYGQLTGWLARVLHTDGDPEAVERTGREIGREIAPEAADRPAGAATEDALTALGFAPRGERVGDDGVRFVLGNCPYRDAVRENQPVICGLHRGITLGLLDRLAPDAELTGFVPKDPYAAGCLVAVAGMRSGA
jgi:predicted ArsR family transcriptional regulator